MHIGIVVRVSTYGLKEQNMDKVLYFHQLTMRTGSRLSDGAVPMLYGMGSDEFYLLQQQNIQERYTQSRITDFMFFFFFFLFTCHPQAFKKQLSFKAKSNPCLRLPHGTIYNTLQLQLCCIVHIIYGF